jgi:hypothetical protein
LAKFDLAPTELGPLVIVDVLIPMALMVSSAADADGGWARRMSEIDRSMSIVADAERISIRRN